jgi:hypothetical protein
MTIGKTRATTYLDNPPALKIPFGYKIAVMSSDPPMRLDEFGPYIFNGDAKVFVVPEEFSSEQETEAAGISEDAFFNEKTKAILRQRMDDMDAGRGVRHSLIEVD